MKRWAKLVPVFMLSTLAGVLQAATYTIAVQPILPEERLQQVYQPLADYLSAQTGETFSIKTFRNFVTYWERMKRQDGFDFVLDAAHFTDWRVKRKGYHVLARLPGTVSFSLVTNDDNFVFEPEELILKKIATMPSPGLGAIRLNEMYPNPMRLPVFVQSRDSDDAARRAETGRTEAAIIPTPLVARYDKLNLVVTTEPVPHMGFSASPDIPPALRQKVQQALVSASQTAAGKSMLDKLNIEAFIAADAAAYDGYGELLQDVFGY